MSTARASRSTVVEMGVAPGGSTNDPWSLIRRRLEGSQVIDPWGLDPDLVEMANWFAPLRWRVQVDGLAHLPAEGPAVLVCNRRLGFDEPAAVVSGLVRNSERYIRLVGAPDLDPLATIAQRFGAIPANVADIAGALRAGQVLALPTRREIRQFHLGTIPLELLQPAAAQRVPVIPVAVTPRHLGASWHVRLGTPVQAGRAKGPRAVAELSVQVASVLGELLEDAASESFWHRMCQNIPGLPITQN